jgi:hypothetical protein
MRVYGTATVKNSAQQHFENTAIVYGIIMFDIFVRQIENNTIPHRVHVSEQEYLYCVVVCTNRM